MDNANQKQEYPRVFQWLPRGIYSGLPTDIRIPNCQPALHSPQNPANTNMTAHVLLLVLSWVALAAPYSLEDTLPCLVNPVPELRTGSILTFQ